MNFLGQPRRSKWRVQAYYQGVIHRSTRCERLFSADTFEIVGVDVEGRSAGNRQSIAGEDQSTRAGSSTKTVNVLCIIGGIMGIASMFFVWTSYSRGFVNVASTLIDNLELIVEYSAINKMFLGECIFCAGAVLSLATTVGGFIQSFGLGTSLWGYSEWSESASSMGAETGVGIGLFIGILSAGIILLSMTKPVGIGYSEKGFRSLGERFKVVCATEPKGKPPIPGKPAKTPSALRLLASDRKWSALLVSSVAISASFAAGVSYQRSTFEPAEEIPGGVAWKMGDGVVSFMGSPLIKITVNDSEQSVVWNITREQTNSTTFAAYDLGYQQIGALNLSLTYIHFGGRTAFGFGDALYLILNGNYTFKEDTEYRMTYSWWRHYPVLYCGNSIELLSTNHTMVVGVGFELHDGEMSSWEIRSSFYTHPRW